MSDQLRYDQRGVSASKSEVHKAIRKLDKGLYPSAFCKILPDIVGGDEDWCNIMHADTAGTKTSLAYLYWKETGDPSVWKGIVQDAIVMNLDDLACVGCTTGIVLSSTIGRNKNKIPGEVIEALISGTTEFLDRLSEWGVKVHLAGGETADVGDIVRTLDVGYTAFARMPRNELVINNIQAGDVIVGLASFGQATYEETYNGGMGSNGLTSARHDVLKGTYGEKYPESFDPNTPQEVVYTGTRSLTEPITANGHTTTVGKLILSPTRTYLPVLAALLPEIKNSLHGLIHCTGGAQTKVLKFIDQVRVVKDDLFPVPPLFQMIQAESGTPWREMYQVFNMGHRLECYVPESVARTILDKAAEFRIEARVIGRVEKSTGREVVIQSGNGTFSFSE